MQVKKKNILKNISSQPPPLLRKGGGRGGEEEGETLKTPCGSLLLYFSPSFEGPHEYGPHTRSVCGVFVPPPPFPPPPSPPPAVLQGGGTGGGIRDTGKSGR